MARRSSRRRGGQEPQRADRVYGSPTIGADAGGADPFVVSPEAYREILARLDAPPTPNARLRKTMQTPAPWD